MIGKLATDEDFRRDFRKDAPAVVDRLADHGLDLTKAEIAALLTLDGEAFERFALSIDPRLQKASLSEPQHCGAPRRRASERIA